MYIYVYAYYCVYKLSEFVLVRVCNILLFSKNRERGGDIFGMCVHHVYICNVHHSYDYMCICKLCTYICVLYEKF